jgi:hypothetical protein
LRLVSIIYTERSINKYDVHCDGCKNKRLEKVGGCRFDQTVCYGSEQDRLGSTVCNLWRPLQQMKVED